MFTLSDGNLSNYIVMVGKGTFNGTSAVMWIGLNTTTGTAKMDALMFNATFLATYGSTYTPKFVAYFDIKTMYLLMDPDSPGLPLLVTVTYGTKIADGSPYTLYVNKLKYSTKTVLTSADLFSQDVGTPNQIGIGLRDDSFSPPKFYYALNFQ